MYGALKIFAVFVAQRPHYSGEEIISAPIKEAILFAEKPLVPLRNKENGANTATIDKHV